MILHLEPFSSYVNPYDMPEATCQEAMSRMLSASRGNLSRVMNELKREGLLDDRRAHVPIGKLRRKTYVLTEVGMREARSLRMKARNKRIQLKDEAGKIFEVRLGDIPMELRDGSSLLDIALSVHMGVFDKQAYIEKIKRETGFVCLDDHRPTIRYFFGREEEQQQIMEWFESDMEKILEIKGVAGIGKTSLAVTVFDELKDRTNTIWVNLNEQSTLISVLEELAAFLSLLGRKKLDTYLKSHPEMRSEDPLDPHKRMGTKDALKSLEEKRSEEILYIFGNECKDLEALIVVDGCEKIRDDLAGFLRFTLGRLSDCDRTKMILVGRTIPKLYDGRKFKRQGLLRRVVLKKLNYEDAKKILQLRGVESWRQREAYKRTGGLPLFLDLMEPNHEFKTADIERYLEEEVLSQLSPSDMRLMRVISIFGRPVHSDAFFQWRGVKHSTIRSLVEKSLLLEASPMYYHTHDILRDFIGKKLKGRTRKTYHKKAAEFFLDQGDVESTVQGLFHLIDAGDVKRVVNILKKEGREIIAKGYSRDLYQLLLNPNIEKRYSDVQELAFLKGECLTIQGSWDEAIDEYNRCLSLVDKERDLYAVSTSLRRIAGIQTWRGDYEDSLKYLRKSARIS
ncbi:MAG: AAA family ATPase, partial [Thermoplasmata archaeon]